MIEVPIDLYDTTSWYSHRCSYKATCKARFSPNGSFDIRSFYEILARRNSSYLIVPIHSYLFYQSHLPQPAIRLTRLAPAFWYAIVIDLTSR